MTHNIQRRLAKALAAVALAIAIVFSGPLLALVHTAQHASAPKPNAANETVVFKQQPTSATEAMTTFGEAAIEI